MGGLARDYCAETNRSPGAESEGFEGRGRLVAGWRGCEDMLKEWLQESLRGIVIGHYVELLVEALPLVSTCPT